MNKKYIIALSIIISLILICSFAVPYTSSKYIETKKQSFLLNIFEPHYTITFNPNTGSGTMSPQEFVYSELKNLKSNTFTKEGYLFTGWNTEANGTGTSYTNNQSVQKLSDQNGATINLFAQWSPITYSVHFDANGGTGTMADQSFTYDVTQVLTSNSYTKDGATFTGWNTAADGSGTSYTDGQQVSNWTITNGAIFNLYAQWNVEDTSLVVTLNRNINPIITDNGWIFLGASGYKVLGITIQNNHSYTIDNWTVEFNSNRQVELNRPTANQLNTYLNPENYYGTIAQTGNVVTVKGNDTLGPGESKTVYVFFQYERGFFGFGETTYEWSNERAYYIQNSGRRNLLAKSTSKKLPSVKMADEIIYEGLGIGIVYDTTVDENGLYSTKMYFGIVNNTGNDITNIKFDVLYNDTNLSKLSSNTIQITSNNEKGASFMSNDTIENQNHKVYEVTGLKTSGGFAGMNISNISFDNVNAVTNDVIENSESSMSNEDITNKTITDEEVKE